MALRETEIDALARHLVEGLVARGSIKAKADTDALVACVVWFAFKYPLALLAIMILLVILMAWLLPRLWRGVRRVITAARRTLGLSG